MDKERKEFEAWWEQWLGEPPMSGWEAIWCGEGYSAEDIDHMWDAWQASRKALVVKLPTWHGYDDCDISGASSAIGDCADAIRSAGITVKGGDQ